jgi:hypothetical protein
MGPGNAASTAGKTKTGGRRPGVINHLSQKALVELARLGTDAPHLALLKIGHDTKNPLPVRVAALGYAAPYFQPRLAPSPPRVEHPVSFDEIRDTVTATEAAAKVIAATNKGEIDIESGKFLLDSINSFSRLYEQQVLELRVMAIEAQLRVQADARGERPASLTIISGGRDDASEP